MSTDSDPPVDKDKADVYSAGERAWMERTQRIRGVLFDPLLRVLVAAKATPNHLTYLSLCAGIAFCPLYFYYSKPWAFVLLALHVFLDGLDGPLARYTNTASRGGSFTDSMCDTAVIAATTITLMLANEVHILPGSLYILTYTLVVIFAMARNIMKEPYSFLFRPRFLIYLWIPVQSWWLPGTMNYLLWASIVLLGINVLRGFTKIRERL